MAKIIVTKRAYQKKYPYVQTEKVIIDSDLEFSQGIGCTSVKQSNGRKLEIMETLE